MPTSAPPEQLDEAQDQLAAERSVKREEVELDIKIYNPETELKRKTRTRLENERTPKDAKLIKDKLLNWRQQAYEKILAEFDIPIEAFMSDKELQRIAKFKLTSLESFDNPGILWSAPVEWKTEVLSAVWDIEKVEAQHKEKEEAEWKAKADAKKAEAEAKRKAALDAQAAHRKELDEQARWKEQQEMERIQHQKEQKANEVRSVPPSHAAMASTSSTN
ncbi:hypothetical protein FS749_007299 [Ceratobasidium sp. UAMH 11750]|nr:hypothetical protein FS749_007299 [Ceratobasidium sp. UAMH 11750]